MGYKQKAPKGELSIDNHRGRIRIRWRYEGDRYSLNLPFAYLPENLVYANVKVAEIKLDMMKNCFDSSLAKYKQENVKKPVKVKPVQEPRNEIKAVFLHELVDRFNDWVTNIKNIDIENSWDYFYVRRLLEKWVDVPVDGIAAKLNGEAWAVTTYNRRLHYLRDFLTWLVKRCVIAENPLIDVCRKREKGKKKNPRRLPLTEDEIQLFLDAIKNNTYCPEAARSKHSYYHPFLSFIFMTGVRNEEAIGLRVKHVDLEKGHIEISEALARTLKGSNHAARIRKGTKTENVRYLPLTDELRELLLKQIKDKALDDLVFPSPRGLSINDQMLEKRISKPIMKKIGLGNRDLYAARHSFGTRAVQQGMVITDVAYLMGHSNTITTMRNYVGVSKPANQLPTMGKQS